jgi:hypothetical protein
MTYVPFEGKRYLTQTCFSLLHSTGREGKMPSMVKRYTLNVSKEVYMALMDLRTKELRKADKALTHDELLRKLLKIGTEEKGAS